jgi:hypothetical protein
MGKAFAFSLCAITPPASHRILILLTYRCRALFSVHGNVNLMSRLTSVLSLSRIDWRGSVPVHVELTVARLKSIYYPEAKTNITILCPAKVYGRLSFSSVYAHPSRSAPLCIRLSILTVFPLSTADESRYIP